MPPLIVLMVVLLIVFGALVLYSSTQRSRHGAISVSSGSRPLRSQTALRPQAARAGSNATLPPPDSPASLMAQSYSSDDAVRLQVVEVIAADLEPQTPARLSQWLPLLGRLSRDANAMVRHRAIAVLGTLQTSRVVPLLRRAMQDPAPEVVATASAAMEKFKGTSQASKSAAKRSKKTKRLPKNH